MHELWTEAPASYHRLPVLLLMPESTWESVCADWAPSTPMARSTTPFRPVFRAHTPYLLLLVELDEQRNEPAEFDGLRLQANLATAEGELAPPEVVRTVGIGTRVKVVFKDIGEGIAMPLWTIDEDAEQPDEPWRYPIE